MAKNNEELKKALIAYRMKKTAGGKIPTYSIFSNDMIEDLIASPPGSLSALKKLKGWGEIRASKYGEDVINILSAKVQKSNKFSK